jgi:hypothetical protein
MKFDLVELQKGDVVLSTIDIGNLPPSEVDSYMDKVMPVVKDTFGCEVALLPVRGGSWDFTIIRNPNRKEKSYVNDTLRKKRQRKPANNRSR